MADTRPLKPHKSFAEQLHILKARGLHVADDTAALALLQRLGYYRLSGYFYPLRKTRPVGQPGRMDEFQPGASLELVADLAEFDKRLRLLTLYAIESVELAVRVAIAHHLGKFDPEAHLNPRLLDGRFTQPAHDGGPSAHQQWLDRHQKLLEDSREDFVAHHLKDYSGRLPLWAAIELWDFGLMSRFFAGMSFRDRNKLVVAFGAVDGEVLKSWLRTFNFLRNVAAHHSRLWNRTLPEIPHLPPLERCRWLAPVHATPDARHKLFGALSCLAVMMKTIAPQPLWSQRLVTHLHTFPQTPLLSLRMAGFPEGWESTALWAPALPTPTP